MHEAEPNRNLASQRYWDESYQGYQLRPPAENDPLGDFIKFFFQGGAGTVLEIGCFPGGYLALFGQLGFILNGIDLNPGVSSLKDWFQNMGFKVGDFHQVDFAEFQPREKYDAVASFGFIEHFTGWEDQIAKHAALVADGGSLVITTPNFRGAVQRFLHVLFDRENYKRHFIPSMDPAAWSRILESLGFEVVFSGYFGKFDFWTDYKKGSVGGFLKRACTYVLGKFLRVMLYPFPPCGAYAPFCGIVARKKRFDPSWSSARVSWLTLVDQGIVRSG